MNEASPTGPSDRAELALQTSEIQDEVEALASARGRMGWTWLAGTIVLVSWALLGRSPLVIASAAFWVLLMGVVGLFLRGSMARQIEERTERILALGRDDPAERQ